MYLNLVQTVSEKYFKIMVTKVRGTVIGFALDWESHKSLKYDRECLTETRFSESN